MTLNHLRDAVLAALVLACLSLAAVYVFDDWYAVDVSTVPPVAAGGE